MNRHQAARVNKMNRYQVCESEQNEQASGSESEQNDSDNNLAENSSEQPSASISPMLSDRLAQWTNQFQIKHNAVDSLLNILRENGHTELPKTARTLLATCDRVDWEVKSGMKYIYMGCKEQLIQHLKMYPSSVLGQMGELDIYLNIDGLPIFKSSNHALWPVLCKINLSPPSVFPFALCYGASKPKNLEFLEEVLRDLHDLMENGLEVGSKNIRVTLRCVTCDAPAKALVKNIKQYSGY